MLARRSLTQRELSDRLKRRKVPRDTAEAIAAEFSRKGYIDEAAIMSDHITNGREHRLAGRFLLRFELKKRGLDKDAIDQALDREYPGDMEPEVAVAFAERKLRSMTGLDAAKRYRRLGAALARRGFSSEIIGGIMDRLDLKPYDDGCGDGQSETG